MEVDTGIDIVPSKRIVRPAYKPVMSEEVESDVQDFLARFREVDKWEAWGMNALREQGPAIMLEGPPGTGKTSIARYIALKIGKGYKALDVAALTGGGGEPGAMENQVREFFKLCKKRGNVTIALDECDHILGDRKLIAGDALTWMLGTIETIMMELNRYKGCVLAMTNHPEKIDPALSDRFLYIIKVDVPDQAMREKLWKMKIPPMYPFQPTRVELHKLSKITLTGRQIETVIINAAGHAIKKGCKPTMQLMELAIRKEKAKHLGRD